MDVVVETPKWSFMKYKSEKGKIVPEYRSLLPNLFNYGYIVGTRAEDGMEADAIVLGKRLNRGDTVDVNDLGTVRFIDDGVADDKAITSAREHIGWADKVKIHAFFTAYMLFKTLKYLGDEGRWARCRYLGASFEKR